MLLAIPLAAFGASDQVASLLDRTVWIDIGAGRTLGSLSGREHAKLQACHTATIGFQKTAEGWAEVSYTGIEMRTLYASAALQQRGGTGTIRFYLPGRAAPAETVHVSGDVMVEETPGFRPRTLLRCTFAGAEGAPQAAVTRVSPDRAGSRHR